MKQISLFIPLLGTLLLSGCAGTSTEFECNATTSDTCMTMEQANEKAQKLEQFSEAKPVAASQPRLAEGNFRTTPVTPPRPLRTGEQTAALWIAPYIDNQDVYHQPSSVFFVIKPSAWGKPRIN
ncbi:type IV conjugative transfer system lipoprotein TraV [Salmonella enterica]|uniref:type IV conjugative transfer system lipoprotein TraV n=1 Tax=Salmonella enterica TaxID=28901 RepID=UPI0021B215FA|nr:type IV conjugative transfer system lipoprotein TraV [Salmonella enterica]EAW8000798.1 type IV conjugative transfer system lipoprotein TraV [Salmonella enterica]ECO0980076.1 type IV conjugative transfer system lipoprotein TraV [Salmonella enterica subsp. enterica serovar Muenchen]EIG0792563.1 type IV conjugative transfer system lipoprotein TraV [Salmonella enterica]EIP4006145.1 type IV conjugative transfer system lipoprotein TraV [Salmonella enterica]EJI3135009.1 type IV conjugative transfe